MLILFIGLDPVMWNTDSIGLDPVMWNAVSIGAGVSKFFIIGGTS